MFRSFSEIRYCSSMSVNRCIGSGHKLRRTTSIRGWGEHVTTVGDEVVFNALPLEDDGVSGNWTSLLVVEVHVNSCRLMIGVDIVCGGERLNDDVVVCRRTAVVRLSMLCCITIILSICTCLVLMTFICFRISDSELVRKKAGKAEGVCVSFVCVNGGGWTGEVAVKWKGSTGDSADSGKNWYGSLTMVPSWMQRRFASAFCFFKDRCSSSKLASFCLMKWWRWWGRVLFYFRHLFSHIKPVPRVQYLGQIGVVVGLSPNHVVTRAYTDSAIG